MTQAITTAVVSIEPSSDAIVLQLRDEILKVKDFAVARKVTSVQAAEDATNDLSIISNLKKSLEDKRKEYLKPLQEYTKNINDTFKLISEPLLEADKITRDKVLAFKQRQEQLRQEAEAAVRLQREADEAARKVREATGEIIQEQTEAPVEVPPEIPTRVFSDLGTSGIVTARKWEVVDFTTLPDKYKEPNTVLIGKIIRAGGDIAGIRTWEEQTLRVTTKGSGIEAGGQDAASC